MEWGGGGIYRGKTGMPRLCEFLPTGNDRVGGLNIGGGLVNGGGLSKLWWR